MDEYHITHVDDDGRKPSNMPEDVAALYSWASLRAGTYRDFSAERREHRAQQRHRVVEARRQTEEFDAIRADAVLANVTAYGASLDDARYDDAGRDGELPAVSRRSEAPVQLDADAFTETREAQREAAVADDLARALERTRREVEAARRNASSVPTSYAELARRRQEIQSKAEAALNAALAAGAVEDLGESPEFSSADDGSATEAYPEPRRVGSGDSHALPATTDTRSAAPTNVSRSSGEGTSMPRAVGPERNAGDSIARGSNASTSGTFEVGGRNIFSRGMDAGRGSDERAQWGRIPPQQPSHQARPSAETTLSQDVSSQDKAPAPAPASFNDLLSDRLVHEDVDTVHLSAALTEVVTDAPKRAPSGAGFGANYGAADGSIFGLNLGASRRAEPRSVESAPKVEPLDNVRQEPLRDVRNEPMQDVRQEPLREDRPDLLARVKRESGIQPSVRPHPAFFSEDGTSGDLVPEARRRRDSATDRLARTERRPRAIDPPAVSFEFRRGGTNGFGEPRVPEVRRDVQERTTNNGSNDGPEWLHRDAPKDTSREHLRTDASEAAESEFAVAARERLEEQQRLHAEARHATELRIAEEDRVAAEAAARSGVDVRASADPHGSFEDRSVSYRRTRIASAEFEYVAEADVAREHPPTFRDFAAMHAAPEAEHGQQPVAEYAQPVERRKRDEHGIDEEHRRAMDEERGRTEREHYFALRQRRLEQSLMGSAPRNDNALQGAGRPGQDVAPQARPAAPVAPPKQEQQRVDERSARDDVRYASTVLEASSAPPQSERRRTPRAVPSEFVGLAETMPSRTIMVANTVPRPQTVSMTDPHVHVAMNEDTLQHSRERMAARWYALGGRMNGGELARVPAQSDVAPQPHIAPSLSVVALWGGTGKTSLVATLGRVLSAAGEKVLLADATTHGLLPYYFGAQELRPDVVRTFTPPPGCVAAPVFMVNYELEELGNDEARKHAAVDALMKHAKGASRVLLDLNRGSAWVARALTQFPSNVLVPISPDMNSVIGLQRVERFFAGCTDADGQPVAVHYLLNQFDASLPLHLDVREVLSQQLGNSLLPVTIRRSNAVPEALADGMTVVDYAPDSPVADDYKALGEWVRALAAPVTAGLRSVRWSER